MKTYKSIPQNSVKVAGFSQAQLLSCAVCVCMSLQLSESVVVVVVIIIPR